MAATGDFSLLPFTPTGDFVLASLDGDAPPVGDAATGDFSLTPFTPTGDFSLVPVGEGGPGPDPGENAAIQFVEDERFAVPDLDVLLWDSEIDLVENEIFSLTAILVPPDGEEPEPGTAYITVSGIAYRVRLGEGRGRWVQLELRRRSISGALLVDTIAEKLEVPVQITGVVGSDRHFTPAEANTFMAGLRAGTVLVSGVVGHFTARARDIGWEDGQDFGTTPPTYYRWVSATLDQI